MTDVAGEHYAAADEIRRLLIQLVIIALSQDEVHVQAATVEAGRIHALLRRLTVELSNVHYDGLWSQAVATAEARDLLNEALRVSPSLPAGCPLKLADLVEPVLPINRLVDIIRGAAGTG